MDDSCRQCDGIEERDAFLAEKYISDLGESNDNSLLEQALKQHRESEQKYKHLIEFAPDAIFIADAESGIILDTNQQAAKLLGIPVAQIIGMHQSQLHPKEDVKKYKKIFEDHIQAGTINVSEDVYVSRKNGQKVPVQINATVTHLGNKKIIYGIFRDITAHKRIEEAFRESEQRFSQIFKEAAEGIVVGDMNTTQPRYVNPALCKMLGYTEQELLEMTASDIHPKESLRHIKDLFETSKKDHVTTIQIPCIRKDGTVIEVQITGSVVDIDGTPHAVGFFSDITEQKQLVNELKASQERFKRLADASFEAIAIHENGRLIDVNQQYLDMFGYTLDEVSTKNVLDMVASESRELVQNQITSGYEGTYEARGRRKNGATFPIEIRVRTSFIDGKSVRISVIRDLSEQHSMEQQLAESEQRYRELYNNAQVALFVTDLNGVLLDCNLTAVDLFGYSRDEKKENYINKVCVTDYYTDKERRKQFLADLQQHRQVINFEAELKRSDGTLFWVSISAKLSLAAGTIEGALYDITASKVLTKVEKKVLDIILQGKSNKEIANILNRSIRTIEDHRAHIMQKLNAQNLVELVQKGQSFKPKL